MLHVEYDENEGTFPKPGNSEVINFMRALSNKYQHRVRVMTNYRPALKEFSPSGKWREGSFEITDIGANQLLFSKLQTGLSLLSDETYLQSWMERYVKVS